MYYLIRLCVKMSIRLFEAKAIHSEASYCCAGEDIVGLAWEQYMRVKRESLALAWAMADVNRLPTKLYPSQRWRRFMDRFVAAGD